MTFSNSKELEIDERRRQSELKAAEWEGVKACQDKVQVCPYAANKDDGSLTHQCLLFARWHLGWIREDMRKTAMSAKVESLRKLMNVASNYVERLLEDITALQSSDYNSAIYDSMATDIWDALPATAKEVLLGLCSIGVLFDGDVPSKTGRDILLELGMAVKVADKGACGYQAATMLGWSIYKKYKERTDAS